MRCGNCAKRLKPEDYNKDHCEKCGACISKPAKKKEE